MRSTDSRGRKGREGEIKRWTRDTCSHHKGKTHLYLNSIHLIYRVIENHFPSFPSPSPLLPSCFLPSYASSPPPHPPPLPSHLLAIFLSSPSPVLLLFLKTFSVFTHLFANDFLFFLSLLSLILLLSEGGECEVAFVYLFVLWNFFFFFQRVLSSSFFFFLYFFLLP